MVFPGGQGGGMSPSVPGWELCLGGSPALGLCKELLSLGKVMDPAQGLPDLKHLPQQQPPSLCTASLCVLC